MGGSPQPDVIDGCIHISGSLMEWKWKLSPLCIPARGFGGKKRQEEKELKKDCSVRGQDLGLGCVLVSAELQLASDLATYVTCSD